MPFKPAHFTSTVVLSVTALALFNLPATGKKKQEAPANEMDPQKRVVHALNRLTFGPRPGDIEQVSKLGLDQWIDLQLHPDKIDDSALNARLAPLRTLQMNSQELAYKFPSGQVIRAVMDGKISMPGDPVEKAIYQHQIAKLADKQEKKQAATLQTANVKDSSDEDASAKSAIAPMNPEEEAKRGDAMFADAEAQQLLALPPEQRLGTILKLSTADQQTLISNVKGDKREKILDGVPPEQRELMMALNNPQQVVNEELLQGKLLRAIYSERQLQEVMTDFWFNHFNVFIGKGADRYMLTDYERDVIRPHALGKFEDLLVATAKSPAMLLYLDNWLSVGPNSDVALGIRKNPPRPRGRRRFPLPPQPPRQAKGKGKRNSGLNENYGRELMELHTLGVNGGYTQRDVTEVARVLTGWTIDQPQKGGGFKFEERMHEPGTKFVLGQKIKQHGEKKGVEVLRLLARHPSTAHFICTKLAMRFVSDDPPPALVENMAQTFLKKDGDIREVLKTMFRSPEFWSDGAYRAKMKTPLEFVVSAVRATGADVADAMPLARQLNQLGMPLYGMQPPTGYSMKSEAWVNSSALLGRMNFSVALMSGKIKGTRVDADRLVAPPADAPGAATATAAAPAPDPRRTLAWLETSLLAGEVSRQTHDAIISQIEAQNPPPAGKPVAANGKSPSPVTSTGTIAGLLLGSPEFQRK